MDFLRCLEEIRTPFTTKLFEIITYGGEELLLLTVMCILYWCVNKRYAYRLSFVYFTSGLMVQSLKIACRVPRPWVIDSSFKPVEGALETATGYSFPSGHTQSATALFGTASLNVKKLWLRLVFVLAIALVMFSRMFLGVHTPQDVLVSFAVTTALVLIVNACVDRIRVNNKNRLVIALLLCAAAIGVMAFSLILYGNGTIEAKYVDDCSKAAAAGIGFAFSWYIETRFINFDEHGCRGIRQLIKLLIGFAVVLAIKFGLKALLGASVPAGIFRYFLLVVWAMVLYPLIIKRFFTDKKVEAAA